MVRFWRKQRYGRRQIWFVQMGRGFEAGRVSMNGFEQKRRCEMTRKGKRQTERRCKLRSVCTRAQQPYRNVAVNPRIGHYLTAGRQRPQIGEQFLHLLWERILSTVVT